VTVISLIATVPVISTGFGCRAIAPPVLPILRPTLSVAGLILPTDLILGLAVGSAGHAPRTRDSARGLTG
jgi:hypothetical protein